MSDFSEYGIIKHDGRRRIKCEICEFEIEKGDYYSEADAGETYCFDCARRYF